MNQDWLEKGKVCTEIFSSLIQSQPQMLPQMLVAWDQAQAKPQQVIISGPNGREDTVAMMNLVHDMYEPGRILLLADKAKNEKFLSHYLLFIKDMEMINAKATAYVCKDFVCKLPVNTLDGLQKQLTTKASETQLK